MALKCEQRKGRDWDRLEIVDGVARHTWKVGRETGERETSLENLDPAIGRIERRTEGGLPYLCMAFFFFVLAYFYNPPPDALWGDVVAIIFLGLTVFLLVVALVRRRKETVELISLRNGSLFAMIRHAWIAKAEREVFLERLREVLREAEGARGRE